MARTYRFFHKTNAGDNGAVVVRRLDAKAPQSLAEGFHLSDFFKLTRATVGGIANGGVIVGGALGVVALSGVVTVNVPLALSGFPSATHPYFVVSGLILTSLACINTAASASAKLYDWSVPSDQGRVSKFSKALYSTLSLVTAGGVACGVVASLVHDDPPVQQNKLYAAVSSSPSQPLVKEVSGLRPRKELMKIAL